MPISVITPPLESDALDSSFSGFSFEHQADLQRRPDGAYHECPAHLIADLPDSPDSLSNPNSSAPIAEQRLTGNLLDSLSSTLTDIATHSHLQHGGHRFHPFHQNGNSIGGGIGGGNHSSSSDGSQNSQNGNQNNSQNSSQNSNHSSSVHSSFAHSLVQSSSSAHSSTAGQSNHSNEQMPETDCYFPTTNMLDYHLNPAYIGELSPTKCNDYQVNSYTSNYYSRLVHHFGLFNCNRFNCFI